MSCLRDSADNYTEDTIMGLTIHYSLKSKLTEAKQVIESWRREYNESRPHRSLGERTPSEFACQIALNGDLTGSQAAENSP